MYRPATIRSAWRAWFGRSSTCEKDQAEHDGQGILRPSADAGPHPGDTPRDRALAAAMDEYIITTSEFDEVKARLAPHREQRASCATTAERESHPLRRRAPRGCEWAERPDQSEWAERLG